MTFKPISRRALIRGIGGTAIALPTLEAMLPRGKTAFAQASPLRYLVCFTGQGLASDAGGGGVFTPNKIGADYDLKPALAPLASVKNEVTVVSGMRIPVGTGPGDCYTATLHDASLSPLLAGVRSITPNGRCRGATSDQIVADAFAKTKATTFHSLAYRIQAAVYAETFFNSRDGITKSQMSYKEDAAGKISAIAPVSSPKLAFSTLFTGFGTGSPTDAVKSNPLLEQRKSVLDLVSTRTAALVARLGGADKRRLEQHLQEVRELERRVATVRDPIVTSTCKMTAQPSDPPIGASRKDERSESGLTTDNNYSDEETRARIFCDLTAMAFACDLTRSASLMFTCAQSFMNAYPILGVKDDLHNLSHHFGSQGPQMVAKGIAWSMKHFAYLLAKMRDTAEGGSSLLDSSAIVFAFESGTKSAHSTDDMALLVAGRAGGAMKPGRHVVAKDAHPAMVLTTAMTAVGVPVDRLGEVSGTIPAVLG